MDAECTRAALPGPPQTAGPPQRPRAMGAASEADEPGIGGAEVMLARAPSPDRRMNARIFAGGERKVSPGIGTSKENSSFVSPPNATFAVRYPSTSPTNFPEGSAKTPPPEAPYPIGA